MYVASVVKLLYRASVQNMYSESFCTGVSVQAFDASVQSACTERLYRSVCTTILTLEFNIVLVIYV